MDAAAAEVVVALQRSGVESILLKGRTFADWLYPGEPRPYVDADLLVKPGQVLSAAEVLGELGYRPFPEHVAPHSHPWLRPRDRAEVDLHVTLWGPHRSPQTVWDELVRHVEVRELAFATVRTLDLPARALHVVLHAAQHDRGKSREDLRRALQLVTEPDWREAERIADRLGAIKEMVVGLRMEPEGQQLLERLPLARASIVADTERAPLAIGFTRLANARGLRARLLVIAEAVMRPPEEYLRPARLAPENGPLPIKRLLHCLSLLRWTPPTLLALWRRERGAKGTRGPARLWS